MINQQIDRLISYGLMTGLVEETDRIYVRNRLLALLKLDSYEETDSICESVDELVKLSVFVLETKWQSSIMAFAYQIFAAYMSQSDIIK